MKIPATKLWKVLFSSCLQSVTKFMPMCRVLIKNHKPTLLLFVCVLFKTCAGKSETSTIIIIITKIIESNLLFVVVIINNNNYKFN